VDCSMKFPCDGFSASFSAEDLLSVAGLVVLQPVKISVKKIITDKYFFIIFNALMELLL